jgi:Protein of unknown function (DUF1573)
MKRMSFILALLAAGSMLFVSSGCQEQATKESPAAMAKTGKKPAKVEAQTKPSGPAPKITFEKTILDLGDVGPDTQNNGQIKFTNTGKGLLKIIKLGHCCGVVAGLANDKKDYAPGESGTITVQWKAGLIPTEFTRQFSVYSNDPANPQAILTFRARIVHRVVCEPPRLRLFLDEENAGCSKITLRSLDKRLFSIKGFKSTADCITASFDPSVEATKFVLQPKVDMEKLQKNLKGRIYIDLTHPEEDIVTVLFDVLPKYTLDPPLIIIFDAEPGKTVTREIRVLNNYKNDFEIESVLSKGGVVGIKVLDKQKISSGYALKVEITPPATSNKIRFTDTFTIKLKGGETLPITCNGYFSKKKPTLPTQ